MIVTKEVEVKLGQRNEKYYRGLNYNFSKSDKLLKVEIDDLLPTTRVDVLVECDFCKTVVKTSYKNYHYNYFNFGLNMFSCSAKCTNEKTKINNLKKWGVEFVNQRVDIKERTRKSSLDRIRRYDDSLIKNDFPDWFRYLVTKEVETTINKWNINHLENIGYRGLILNQKWIIPVQHLMSNSSIKVECKCDCGKIVKNIFQKFMINFNRSNSYNCKACNNFTLKKFYMKNYGVENSMQLDDIFQKGQLTGLKLKEYKGVKYQGTYELDFLKFCDDENILDKVSKTKSIRYLFDDKYKYYHPDFYIKELNLIVEIKSDYYFELHQEKNLCKQKACLEQGHDFIFIINKDYRVFLSKIKKSS